MSPGHLPGPVPRVQAKQARKLVPAEPRRDAEPAVMPTDPIGSDRTRERGEEPLLDAAAAQVAEDQQAGMFTGTCAKFTQLVVGEMVQDQIARDDRVLRPFVEMENVPAMPRRVARPGGRARSEIDSIPANAASVHRQAQVAFAGADFQHPFTGAQLAREDLSEPARVPQSGVENAQVPA